MIDAYSKTFRRGDESAIVDSCIGFLVISGCTLMESRWTRWRCIHRLSSRCHPARQCCHRLFAGIIPPAGMYQLSLNSLLSAPVGRPTAAPVRLSLMSRLQIRKMHISLDMWLMVVPCSQQLVVLCWPGDNLLEWMETLINRHVFLSTTFIFTDPSQFHCLVNVYTVIKTLMFPCLCTFVIFEHSVFAELCWNIAIGQQLGCYTCNFKFDHLC